jgi:hypothetical protein
MRPPSWLTQAVPRRHREDLGYIRGARRVSGSWQCQGSRPESTAGGQGGPNGPRVPVGPNSAGLGSKRLCEIGVLRTEQGAGSGAKIWARTTRLTGHSKMFEFAINEASRIGATQSWVGYGASNADAPASESLLALRSYHKRAPPLKGLRKQGSSTSRNTPRRVDFQIVRTGWAGDGREEARRLRWSRARRRTGGRGSKDQSVRKQGGSRADEIHANRCRGRRHSHLGNIGTLDLEDCPDGAIEGSAKLGPGKGRAATISSSPVRNPGGSPRPPPTECRRQRSGA